MLRKLILAEPGGELDSSLDPAVAPGPSQRAAGIAVSAEKVRHGDIDGGLKVFSIRSRAIAHGRTCLQQRSSNYATMPLP